MKCSICGADLTPDEINDEKQVRGILSQVFHIPTDLLETDLWCNECYRKEGKRQHPDKALNTGES